MMSESSTLLVASLAAWLVLALGAGGCAQSKPTTTPSGTSETTSANPRGTTATASANATEPPLRGDGIAVPSASSIPPGRVIRSEGKASYTFREEWRRAIKRAQEWDRGAYLVQAFGDSINNQGVPSEWTMFFRRQTDDDLGVLKIDPWGNVTEWAVVAGGAAGTKSASRAILPTVIDSDRVAKIGPTRLKDLSAASLTEQKAQLQWAEDGSRMQWLYVVYQAKKRDYIAVDIDALDGTIRSRRRYPQDEMP